MLTGSGVCPAFATTYYVDAANGNDKNIGSTAGQAWQTLQKVSSSRLVAGDEVLFRRGQTFYGTLRPNSSGEPTKPIVFGAFGKGELPIIGGICNLKQDLLPNIVLDWVAIKPNIWQLVRKINGKQEPFYEKNRIITRLWLNTKEQQTLMPQPCAGSATGGNTEANGFYNTDYLLNLLCSQIPWHFIGEKQTSPFAQKGLFFYSTTKPKIEDIEIETAFVSTAFQNEQVYACFLKDLKGITLNNLDLQGKTFGCVMQFCSNITISGCNIGKKIGFEAIVASSVRNLTIKNNNIDADFNLNYLHNGDFAKQGLPSTGPQHGIKIDNAATNISITENNFRNWAHGCISILAQQKNSNIDGVKIYKNYFSGEGIAYCRAIGTSAVFENTLKNVEIMHNCIYKMTASSQIGGENIDFEYNIFYECAGSINTCHCSAAGRNANYRDCVLAITGSNGAKGICKKNIYKKNLFYDSKVLSIQIDGGAATDLRGLNNISGNTISDNYFIFTKETADTLKTLQIRTAKQANGSLSDQKNTFSGNITYYTGKIYAPYMVYASNEVTTTISQAQSNKVVVNKYNDAFLNNFTLLDEKDLAKLSKKIGANVFTNNRIVTQKPKIPFLNQLYNPFNLPLSAIAK